ncbi:MAG: DUF2779 domain-containing protein [Bacteroidales bacterium]|nr:DUF2779 domain-containing protein [Bacteroidales bacterium]
MLSKSRILRGYQCKKSLYLYTHHPDLRDELTEQQQAIFETGTEVGKLACQLFPGGKYGTPEGEIPSEDSINHTRDLITQGEKVIYEATFVYDDILVAVDILVKTDNCWQIYEVKSATKVKDINIIDIASQQYVLAGNGLTINRVFLVYLNNQYVRNGNLNVESLFVKEDVSERVDSVLPTIPELVAQLKDAIKQSNIPDIDIGPYCSDPYDCDFMGHCWQHIPENSVFNISRLNSRKKFELYNEGIIEYKDIPQDFKLNDKQQLQIDAYLNNEDTINASAIRKFCAEFKYPLYFFDFETFQPPVPLFNHSKPYQQIPFQYSVHYKESADSQVQHLEFLANPNGDPRPPLMEAMINHLGKKGDIVAYHASFEKSRIKEMAADFPKYKSALEEIIPRIKDLEPIFSSKNYYTPAMKGKSSIKQVLPALIPELSYEGMEIANGGMASTAFSQLYTEKDQATIDEVRNNLLKYCELDTFAMVRILEKLESY